MLLRAKIIASLTLIGGGYNVAYYFVQQATILSKFDELEVDEAQKTTVNIKSALERETLALSGQAMNWATSDGVSEFMEGARPEFADARLREDVLSQYSVDMLFMCDAAGKVLWERYAHPESAPSTKPSELSGFVSIGEVMPAAFRTGWRPEDQARGLLRAQKGILSTELGPLLLSTEPVARSSGTGGYCGFVLLGKFVSSQMVKELAQVAEAKGLEISFYDEASASPELVGYVENFNGEPKTDELDEDWLRVNHLMNAGLGSNSMGRAPWLMIQVDVAREISKLAKVAANSAVLSTLAGGFILMLLVIMLIQKIVLTPIKSLMTNALAISEDDTADVHFALDRNDEVGVLSREFDNMMDKLNTSKAALVDTAREAGKSEIATGILHNVGNVLNSVNVSCDVIAKKAEGLAIGDLEALNAIVVEHADDLAGFMSSDPRGKHFQPFLSALTEQLGKEQESITTELRSLDEGIDRIRDLVNSQQDYVNRTEVIELCELQDLIERALSVSNDVEAYHRGFEIVREFQDVPRLAIDRYKTLEVLVNLIQNARQSIEEQAGEERRLTLHLSAPNPNSVLIEVEDTGVGVEPQNIPKLFDHGYSTKADGHGFGLHSAANAANEMGGALTARSDGPGRGAVFALELPVRVSQSSPERV